MIEASASSSRPTSAALGGTSTGVSNDGELAPQQFGQAGKALAVGAVDRAPGHGRARDQGVDRRLDRKRATALHGHAHVRCFGVDDRRQALAHARGHGIEVAVPGTPVAQHRGLGRERGRQRTRRQQDGITVEIAHRRLAPNEIASLHAGSGLRHAGVRAGSQPLRPASPRHIVSGRRDDQSAYRGLGPIAPAASRLTSAIGTSLLGDLVAITGADCKIVSSRVRRRFGYHCQLSTIRAPPSALPSPRPDSGRQPCPRQESAP